MELRETGPQTGRFVILELFLDVAAHRSPVTPLALSLSSHRVVSSRAVALLRAPPSRPDGFVDESYASVCTL